jgi:hypothetical protein
VTPTDLWPHALSAPDGVAQQLRPSVPIPGQAGDPEEDIMAKGGANDGKGGEHAKPGGPAIGPKPSPDGQKPMPDPKHGGRK